MFASLYVLVYVSHVCVIAAVVARQNEVVSARAGPRPAGFDDECLCIRVYGCIWHSHTHTSRCAHTDIHTRTHPCILYHHTIHTPNRRSTLTGIHTRTHPCIHTSMHTHIHSFTHHHTITHFCTHTRPTGARLQCGLPRRSGRA